MLIRSVFTLPGMPRAAMSRATGFWARRRIPRRLRERLWPLVCDRFGIARAEVPGPWTDYSSFLDLFTRPLPEGTRPLPPDDHGWLSPADGRIVDATTVSGEGSWVVKGSPYSLRELLPGTDPRLAEGWQAVQIYLAPRDYHRFHAPCTLEVIHAIAEPGALQTVDPALTRRSWRVLARNRRVLLHCRTPRGERFALLFVGALNVGGMRFTFDATLGGAPWVASARTYDPPAPVARGAELGRFELGSTVVIFGDRTRGRLVPVGAACRAREPLLAPPSCSP